MKKLDTQSPGFKLNSKHCLLLKPRKTLKSTVLLLTSVPMFKKRGDAALIEYTNRFDGTSAQTIDDFNF